MNRVYEAGWAAMNAAQLLYDLVTNHGGEGG